MLAPTILLDDVFDPDKGWPFSPHKVPISRAASEDGNPYYAVSVDGVEVVVFEIRNWEPGVQSNVAPTRLVAMTAITGVSIDNPLALLSGTASSRGMPALGIAEDGSVQLFASVPIAEGFPVDWARKQLMVCMGLVAEDTRELLRAWNQDDAPAASGEEFDWDTAKNIASVAGSLLRAFVGT